MRSLIKKAATVAVATCSLVGLVGVQPAAAENCLGFPSIPQTYLCIVSVNPENAIPSTTTEPVIVPGFCYFIGCQPDTTVNVPVAQPGQGAVLVFTYNGQTYEIPPGTSPVDPAAVIAALNDLLRDVGLSLSNACRTIAGVYNQYGPGYLVCNV